MSRDFFQEGGAVTPTNDPTLLSINGHMRLVDYDTITTLNMKYTYVDTWTLTDMLMRMTSLTSVALHDITRPDGRYFTADCGLTHVLGHNSNLVDLAIYKTFNPQTVLVGPLGSSQWLKTLRWCSTFDGDDIVDIMRVNTSITDLDLTESRADHLEPVVAALCSNTTLQRIVLPWRGVLDADLLLPHITELFKRNQLLELEMPNLEIPQRDTVKFAEALLGTTSLTTLRFTSEVFQKKEAAAWARVLAGHPSLTNLHLGSKHFMSDEVSMQLIEGLGRNTVLKRLTLPERMHVFENTAPGMTRVLAQNTTLTTLNFHGWSDETTKRVLLHAFRTNFVIRYCAFAHFLYNHRPWDNLDDTNDSIRNEYYRIPLIRFIARTRVMCQAGRAASIGARDEMIAWICERAPLWVVVHVVAMLRAG